MASRESREPGRRAEAARILAIGESTCRYGATQLANGISPAEAVEVAGFIAGELSVVAESVRRLVRLGPVERRELAVRLAGLGMPVTEIARRVGVGERMARKYVRRDRLTPGERREVAVELAARGLSAGEVAGRLGVGERAVRGYVRGVPRRCPRCRGRVTGRADKVFCSARCRGAAHRGASVDAGQRPV